MNSVYAENPNTPINISAITKEIIANMIVGAVSFYNSTSLKWLLFVMIKYPVKVESNTMNTFEKNTNTLLIDVETVYFPRFLIVK